MEIATINPPPHHADFDFPINPSSRTTNPNCITTKFTISDIEMIALHAAAAAAYTSLKDLMPSTPTSVMSPTLGSRSSSGGSGGGRDSWRDIPIKDPLLQHAAWAYLQPMAPDHQADSRTFVQKLKDRFCGVFGCFKDVILAIWLSFSSSSSSARGESVSGEGEEGENGGDWEEDKC